MSHITADVHQLQATHRLQVTVTKRQYDLLAAESDRTALSIAELVRRCIDSTLRPHRRLRYRGLELVLTVSPEVDPALTGRRVRLKGQTGARRRPIREED